MNKKVTNETVSGDETDPPSQMVRGKMGRRAFLKGALTGAPLLIAGPTILTLRKSSATGSFGNSMGPSTTTEPYLVPSQPGVMFVSILTVGDTIDSYRMVGLPDGLGAFESGRGDFTLLMNHELVANVGVVRPHGSKGAFVSQWTIDSRTLKVKKGKDFSQSPNDVYTWDPATNQYLQGTTMWQRHCSADLPKQSAFYYRGKGTKELIYINGEEVTDGRAWGRVATGRFAGKTWELPHFGNMSYENAVASPFSQEKTVVVLLDDSALSTAPTGFPSEVYVYVGTKAEHGHPIVRAGLVNGKLYGVKISVKGSPVTEESNDFGLGTASTGFIGKGKFSLHDLGDVSALNGTQLEKLSIAADVARLQRVEDGAWDPRKNRANDFYFVTTASLTSNCRLWRLRFDNIEQPEKGGTIEILLRGDEGHGMLDNVTIDQHGRILMDEDPGRTERSAKIWLYDIGSRKFIQVGEHNPKFFDPTILNNSAFITQDEESSGLIDAEHILGRGWFLFDVQVHKASTDTELVEGGQLLAMYVDPSVGADN
jgi:hypothetical protein